jgi:hypothetical protein
MSTTSDPILRDMENQLQRINDLWSRARQDPSISYPQYKTMFNTVNAISGILEQAAAIRRQQLETMPRAPR